MKFKTLTKAAVPGAKEIIRVLDANEGKFMLSKAAMEKLGLYKNRVDNSFDRVEMIQDEDDNTLYIAKVNEGGTAITSGGKGTHKTLAAVMSELGGVCELGETIEHMGITWHKVVKSDTQEKPKVTKPVSGVSQGPVNEFSTDVTTDEASEEETYEDGVSVELTSYPNAFTIDPSNF